MCNTTRILHLGLVIICVVALVGASGGIAYSAHAAPAPGVFAASIIRVTTAGATSGACGSTWGSACSLQHALNDIAVSSDEIWVAAGTYKPTTGSDRSATFQLESLVDVYGGFAMTETLRSQRNWTANITILSGDIGVVGNSSDNSYHVVMGTSAGGGMLDGFTVTGGNANGSYPDDKGGGMYNPSATNATVANVIFDRNSASQGGGMYNDHSGLTLTNITLSYNSASQGGGMYNDNGINVVSYPRLTSVAFIGNSATSSGGGMVNSYSNPTLTNVTFNANSVTGSNSNGGGMLNDHSSPTLLNITFSGNSTAGGDGGALYNDLVSTPVLTNVTFYSNTAVMSSGYNGGNGGAIYNYATSNYTMTNVTFNGNSAVGYDALHPTHGGAMYTASGSATARNAIFWGNTPDQAYNDSSTVTANTSVVQGGCPTGSACSGITTADPLLGALGTANDSQCPATDARGVARPQGAHCDIGAFESSRFTLGIVGGNNQSTLINTAFAQPLQVSVTANNASEPVNGGKITFTPPASGASASLATSPATIAGGAASVNATANGVRGSYLVTATMAGANSVSFNLRNLIPTVFYVKPGASGNCSSWATACNMPTALGSAGWGDEIWAAAGTYTPTTGAGRDATFPITNGVGIYGGFACTETARSQRNWTTNVTILSGDIGTVGDPSDNAYHVLTAHGTDSQTVLDGVTVTGGRGTGQVGGGVFIDNNGSLTIANCRITDNSAEYGGGLFQGSDSGRVSISNSRIELNTTTNHGGGLFVGGNVTMMDTQVLSNTAGWHGGGLHVASGRADLVGGLFSNNRTSNGNGGGVNLNNSISVTGTQFISNTANDKGGALTQWNEGFQVTLTSVRLERNTAKSMGGGAFVSGTLTISNSAFVSNTVDSGNNNTYGGGVYAGGESQFYSSSFTGNAAGVRGGGLYTSRSATIQFSTFERNDAWYGGGMFSDGSSPTLTNVVFSSNTGSNGGGMCSQNGAGTLINVTFSGNSATEGGGVFNWTNSSPTLINVVFRNNWAFNRGGGMYNLWNSNPTLINVTFSGNLGGDGGGMHNYDSNPTLVNCIMWGNSAPVDPQIGNTSGTPVITYSDIQGGYAGAGNINADPQFVMPITATAAPTVTGDYHLRGTSPAIDAGNNYSVTVSTDMDGRPRKVDMPNVPDTGQGTPPIVDMGAYEYHEFKIYLPMVVKN